MFESTDSGDKVDSRTKSLSPFGTWSIGAVDGPGPASGSCLLQISPFSKVMVSSPRLKKVFSENLPLRS